MNLFPTKQARKTCSDSLTGCAGRNANEYACNFSALDRREGRRRGQGKKYLIPVGKRRRGERVRAKMFIGETMQFNLIVRKKAINRYQFKG